MYTRWQRVLRVGTNQKTPENTKETIKTLYVEVVGKENFADGVTSTKVF